MKEFTNFDDVYNFCKAIASPIRAKIVNILSDNPKMNLQDLAQALKVTNGALTSHIKLLSSAGIINVESINGSKGIQKVCSLNEQRYVLDFSFSNISKQSHDLEIPIGSYFSYDITPTCGLATAEHVIGYFDNPIYFNDPERIYANLLWFYTGYVEYSIPNYLQKNEILTEVSISQELCSQSPFARDSWPSDIHFSINDIPIAIWTSPTDFCITRGIYTPAWWDEHKSQYGMLKILRINENGVYLDNQKINDVTLNDLGIVNGKPFKYRISVPENTANVGGCNLFGKGFGNYNQDILVSFVYETSSPSPAK